MQIKSFMKWFRFFTPRFLLRYTDTSCGSAAIAIILITIA
jgi:hypothetical protein